MKKIKTLQCYSFIDGGNTYIVNENAKYNSFCIIKKQGIFSEEEATKFIDRNFDLINYIAVARKNGNTSAVYECVSTLDKKKDKLIVKAYETNPVAFKK